MNDLYEQLSDDENILWELNKKKKQCQKLNHLLNDKRKMPR